jgi:hypothetical protein
MNLTNHGGIDVYKGVAGLQKQAAARDGQTI